MKRFQRHSGFTLVELLVVVAIIAVLSSILVPSVGAARESARSISCLNNLRNLGSAMKIYHADNDDKFWPYVIYNSPEPDVHTYFWGTTTDPVDPEASPLMNYCGNNLAALWCPEQRWGTYVPQGRVSEPTTNYGYNAFFLGGWGKPGKQSSQIPNPGELFIFADSAMYWGPGGVDILQNSTYLEPVFSDQPFWVQTPTTQFRHRGRSNALCGDGHADSFDPEGWRFAAPYDRLALGFVGTENDPHYAQE